jgi:hypothetical protein
MDWPGGERANGGATTGKRPHLRRFATAGDGTRKRFREMKSTALVEGDRCPRT